MKQRIEDQIRHEIRDLGELSRKRIADLNRRNGSAATADHRLNDLVWHSVHRPFIAICDMFQDLKP